MSSWQPIVTAPKKRQSAGVEWARGLRGALGKECVHR